MIMHIKIMVYHYIYDVEARANGLEYDVKIDAVSGKILKVEIDN